MIERIKRRTPLARKSHGCQFCSSLAIQAGQAYVRDTLVYEGRVYDWVACCACDQLVVEVCDWSGGYGDDGIGSETFFEWACDNTNLPEAVEFLKRYIGDDGYLDYINEGE